MLLYLQAIETARDRTKFEGIYHKYRGLMFYIARQILPNQQDAEDAVHQAFLSILENLKKISDAGCPKTRAFCVIVTERKALDIIRKQKRLTGACADELRGVEIPLPGDSPLADAMAGLSARYREALLLRYDMGYSVREMAGILELNQAAVEKLIWRAKKALSRALEED